MLAYPAGLEVKLSVRAFHALCMREAMALAMQARPRLHCSPISTEISCAGSLMMKLNVFNPFMTNVFCHPYQLDESISNFRIVRWYFSIFFFIFLLLKLLSAYSGDPDRTPRFCGV